MLLEATKCRNSNRHLLPLSSALIAFKPRQVLLAHHKPLMMKQTKSLQPHHKTLLLHSVLRYVEKCGFSKTLKRFLSEAQIEDDKWKASSLDLEHLFCEYSDKCAADGSLNIYKGKDLQTDGINRIDGNVEAGSASEETIKKKKKKKSDESDVKAGEDKSKTDVLEKNEDDTVTNESSKKHKDKKKKKSTPVTESDLVVGGEEKPEPLLGHNNDNDNNNPKVELETKDEKKKKKKEKKKKPSNDSPALEDAPNNSLEDKKVEAKDKRGTEVLNTVTKESLNETSNKEKKSSKRKRLAEDENKSELVNEEAIEEEPKRRKTEAIGEVEAAKSEDQLTKADGHKPSKDQLNEHENGKLDNNGGGKSARKKSETKQNNGSAEPKSAKAFQRVKIDEVEFADEKLQDNSYWAMDGAEIGYGAKAQEVLGQVRGRDFRHEKTKKKRGSYRGGQIDLDSHSIKFNYSDED